MLSMYRMEWPLNENTQVSCLPRRSLITDSAIRLRTTSRSSPFLTRDPGMMKTEVPSSGTSTSRWVFPHRKQ